MSRLILHIGTHKTATTAVQEGFAARRAELAAAGVIYPRIGPEDYPCSGHHALAADWNPLLAPYALAEGSRAALVRIAADHAGGEAVVFLSSEEFSRGREGGQVDFAALRAAAAGFERIEVLCVLRDQWQFLQSVWIELARSRQPPPPRKFVEAAVKGELVAGLWSDYSRLYAHLRQSFAADEITFLDYRQAARAPGGVPGALLRHLGVTVEPALLRGMRANVSPMPLAMWAACRAAGAEPPTPGLIQAASSAFWVQFGLRRPNTLWDRGQLQVLRDYGQAANERLRAAMEADGRKGITISTIPLGEEAVHPEDLTEGFWLRLAQRQFAAARA